MCQQRRTDLMLTGKIAVIHRRPRDSYGSPNIHAERSRGSETPRSGGAPVLCRCAGSAVDGRDPASTQQGPCFSSDGGSQYTSYASGKRCQEAGIMPSMDSVGNVYVNAMEESFFATLEREVLNRGRFRTQAEVQMAMFDRIEGWHNPYRWHSRLRYRSTVNYEGVHHQDKVGMAELLPPSAADLLLGNISKAA